MKDLRNARMALRRFVGHEVYREHLNAPIRVAHLTDQHFGRVTPTAIQQQAIDVANQQKPDIVAITGDFVCHSLSFLDEMEDVLSRLNAPVVCVLGNHDHWAGAHEVEKALKRAGACVLRNAHTTIHIRGARIQIVGLDDAYTGHSDVGRATKGLNASLPSLGLSHIAEEAEELWHHGVPLVLAGHTHAGQIAVAGLHELAIGRLAGHRFVHGLYGARTGQSGAVYVGAGIGAAVMPFRAGDRGKREVAVFELGAALGTFEEHHQEQSALPPWLSNPRHQGIRQRGRDVGNQFPHQHA